MKHVVHIVDGIVTRADVPDNWIQCSISGEYRPPEEFRREGEAHQSRTNCTRTYLMTMVDSAALAAQLKKLMPAVAKMQTEVQRELLDKTAGISVAECIAMLQEIAASNPNARIVKIDDGYMDPPCLEGVVGYNNLYSL